MKNIKNEKGSLALFVTIAMLFFMAFLLALFLSTTNEQKTQLAVTARIKEIYEKDVNNIEEIYNTFIGTEEYIPIYTAEQLKKVGTGESVYISEIGKYYTFNLDSKYILKNNIELNKNKYTITEDGKITFSSDAEQWTSIGTSANPFTGVFDGDKYKISGLYINNNADNRGLFANSSGSIKNLTLDNGYIKGNNWVGGFVGQSIENSYISNCINKNQVIGNGFVGGISGRASGTIENCVNYSSIGLETSKYNIGGIFGYSNSANTKVNNCSNFGNIIGSQAGGIGGTIVYASIKECYNNGAIDSIGQAGGIIGYVYESGLGTIENCYNLKNISGYRNIGGIVGFNNSTSLKILSCYNIANINATEKNGRRN